MTCCPLLAILQVSRRVTYLSLQQRCLERLIIHLKAHLDSDLFDLTLTAAYGILNGVRSFTNQPQNKQK